MSVNRSNRFRALTRAFAAACLVFALQPERVVAEELERLVDLISAEVRPDDAMERMRKVWEKDRWFTFPKFAESADFVERTLGEIGLKDVERGGAAADGETQVGFWTMPLAWDVAGATIEIIEPSVPDQRRILVDYQRTPASLGMWSGSTPPGGIVAEVVEAPDSASLEALDLKGKLALTADNSAGMKARLAAAGALGALNAFTENQDLKQERQWVNSWGDNGWGYIKGSKPLLSFSLSPSESAYLRDLLKTHGSVRLRATVDSRYYKGVYPWVTGVIRGAGDNDEEVLTLGHIAEQGAHDNATGVAAMIEAMAALNRLIEAGELARPDRAIRILAMPEMYGSLDHIAKNRERIGRTVGAMCLDTPAGFYEMDGTEYTFYLNPLVARSYADSLILETAAAYFPRLSPPRPWHWKPHMGGTDNYLGDPTIGVPTAWPYSGSGVHTHHNSADKPDTVDPRSLRDLTVVTAAYIYYLASAGEAEAIHLAEAGVERGRERIELAMSEALKSVQTAAADVAQAVARGDELVNLTVERESQAVVSVERLVPAAERESLRRRLLPMVIGMRAFGREQADLLHAAAAERAEPVGLSGEPSPAAATRRRHSLEAERMIVRRKRFGSIPLDDLSALERGGRPAADWWKPQLAALYWCDGRRNLAEVIRRTELEMGPVDFDFVDYFRFLERKGYVEFVER